MTTEYGVSDFRYQMPQVTVPGDPQVTYDYFYNAILYMMVTQQDQFSMTFYDTTWDYLQETLGGTDLAWQAYCDAQGDYHEYGCFYESFTQGWQNEGSSVTWTLQISDPDFYIGDTFGYQNAFLLSVPYYAQQIADDGMVTPAMSDYEVAEYLYRYMAMNFAYDTTYHPISYTGYGMLANGVGVCQGYVSVYNALCKMFGIDIVGVVGSTSGEDHIWSYANLDGEWLYIDPTWGDSHYDGVTANMDYFAVSYATLSKTHIFDS